LRLLIALAAQQTLSIAVSGTTLAIDLDDAETQVPPGLVKVT
jgi:hypothetical protein